MDILYRRGPGCTFPLRKYIWTKGILWGPRNFCQRGGSNKTYPRIHRRVRAQEDGSPVITKWNPGFSRPIPATSLPPTPTISSPSRTAPGTASGVDSPSKKVQCYWRASYEIWPWKRRKGTCCEREKSLRWRLQWRCRFYLGGEINWVGE